MAGEYEAQAARLAPAARALADETRLRILLRLVERPATVTELSTTLEVPQPRVSSHLRVLADAGLVDADRAGRLRHYRLNVDRAEALLTGLHYAAVAEDGGITETGAMQDSPEHGAASPARTAAAAELRLARRCYDHLAGLRGVELLDLLLERRWLTVSDDPSPQPRYQLTRLGVRSVGRLGIDPVRTGTRRLPAFGCSDWTEQRPHLGGGLASQLTAALERDKIITINPGDRIISVHGSIEDWLTNAA